MDVAINLCLPPIFPILHFLSIIFAYFCLASFVASVDILIKVATMSPVADFLYFPTDTFPSSCPRPVHWYLLLHLAGTLGHILIAYDKVPFKGPV